MSYMECVLDDENEYGKKCIAYISNTIVCIKPCLNDAFFDKFCDAMSNFYTDDYRWINKDMILLGLKKGEFIMLMDDVGNYYIVHKYDMTDVLETFDSFHSGKMALEAFSDSSI